MVLYFLIYLLICVFTSYHYLLINMLNQKIMLAFLLRLVNHGYLISPKKKNQALTQRERCHHSNILKGEWKLSDLYDSARQWSFLFPFVFAHDFKIPDRRNSCLFMLSSHISDIPDSWSPLKSWYALSRIQPRNISVIKIR